MTVLDPEPFAIVTVPVLGVRVLPISFIDTRVPAPLFTSGLAVGNDVSLAIGTNPPTHLQRLDVRDLLRGAAASHQKPGPCA